MVLDGKGLAGAGHGFMEVTILTLSLADGRIDDSALQQLLSDQGLLEFREHMFFVAGSPHLACIVTHRASARGSYRPHVPSSAAAPAARPKQRERSDAKEDPMAGLSEGDRGVFETMRVWRAQLAKSEGVPPYVILSNRELKAIVQARPQTKSALLSIDGIGRQRLERHGEAMLEALARASSPTSETSSAQAEASANTIEEAPTAESEAGPQQDTGGSTPSDAKASQTAEA